jgi:hypothetical protein
LIEQGGTVFGRATAVGIARYLQHANQLDVDPLTGSTIANNSNLPCTTTARRLVGNDDTSRFLHDQMLMDIAPQANETNENIDGTKTPI